VLLVGDFFFLMELAFPVHGERFACFQMLSHRVLTQTLLVVRHVSLNIYI